MSASTFEEMREHIGHNIVCVCYGKDGEDLQNVAVECETCDMVLFDLNPDQHYERIIPDD